MGPTIPSPHTNSRRVPPDLRKRAALSCDLCKTRRRRCVRSVSGRTCQLCKENEVNCITTIQRKQRNWTPLRDVSPRHIVMEQLMARLFPSVAIRDVSQLVKLSEYLEKNNVEMCCVGDKLSVSANSVENIVPAAPSLHRPSRERIARPLSKRSLVPTSEVYSYERILQNSSGTLCYFGPSSSMAFVMQLREDLVLNENQNLEGLQPKQRRLRENFAADSYCCTMEKAPAETISEACSPGPVHLHQAHPGDESPANAQSTTRPNPPLKFVNILPLRQEVEELVEIFFVHAHPNMVLFHRPIFESALEDLWASEGKSEDVGWVVCCCVVLGFGCEHIRTTSNDKTTSRIQSIRNLQRQLIEMALGKVAQLILSATIQSVQAFALLSLYLNATNQRNASWIMMGCGIRMAISLGMHRGDKSLLRGNIRLTPVERELRKRVWWTIYIYEQYNGALFGRPGAVDETETTTDLPNESILEQCYHQPPGLIKYDVCLARIVGRIRKSQADQGRFSGSGEHGFHDSRTVHQLLQELDTWYHELPPFLKFDKSNQRTIYPSHFRQLVTLQLRFQHARLLLARPFHLNLLQKPSSVVQDEAVVDLVAKFGDICVEAAFESWKLTQHLRERGQFNGNLSLDGVFIYQCGMVLSLACLDTRQRSSTRSRKDLETAIESILNILRSATTPNKPMSRLIQIADDFSSIVRSMGSGSALPATHDEHHDNQQLSVPQTCHSPFAEDALARRHQTQTDHLRANVTAEDVATMNFSRNPPLASSSVDDLRLWDFEGAQLIDSMLDWDFLQAFGFDAGGELNQDS